MRAISTIRTAVRVLLLIGACMTAVFSVSVFRHATLAAYGLSISDGGVALVIAGIGGITLLFALLAVLSWKAPRFPFWAVVAATLLCVPVGAFSVFGAYCLEVKYEKGDSNLRHLAAYSRDLPAWQSRAQRLRTGILRAANLAPMPLRTPLNPVAHSRREHDGYSVENVILETVSGFFLAGNLYRPLPSGENVRNPVVLIPQGHFHKDRFEDDNQQLAATFARMGALAFLYDMVGRGETKQVDHHNPNALTVQLWDSMRVLDFLLALPEADPKRVAMTGASGGGTQTFLCAAVDERVTVSAPVVMVSSWVYGGCECESGLPIHATSEYRTNNAEIAALTAPRPQLIVSDDEDWTRTAPIREFPYMRSIYRLFGKEDFVKNVHLPGEHHDFGPSKRDAVYRFLAKHLGLALECVSRPDGTIDETRNTIESQSTMRAFDDAHPLPERSLHGWDALMAAFKR